ncbi:FtsX-like permease family protein [Actinoplanes sp. NPDC049596]|uniref:FtsX-like permease family protein n=1 Tax=unclassified Actinoplanes TaxID=2626549 RepID=UPI00342FB0B3
MYYVSFGAVRRRSGQALLVLLLAALAATAASAAAWYGLTVSSRAADTDVRNAPAGQHVILSHGPGRVANDPRGALDSFAATVDGLLKLPDAKPVLGLAADMTYIYRGQPGAASGMPAAYRDGFCDNVRLTGACPAAANDAAISADAAAKLRLKPGDTFDARAVASVTPMRFRVSGVYQAEDPNGPYWADKLFKSQGSLDPFFTPLDTFRAPQLDTAIRAWGVDVPAPLLRGDGGYDLNGVVTAARPGFAAAQLDLDAPVGELVDQVRGSRIAVAEGVLIAAGQTLLLAWFALGLAGRFTGRDRRSDAGLLLLRGTTRGGVLRLAAGQHLLPLAGGALIGWLAGPLIAWPFAGGWPVRVELWPAALLALAAVLAATLIGLAVLTGVDAVATRAPVVALLRRVPSHRHDWRSGVVDVALVALAVGAVYQARTGGAGLGAVAPAMAALAVGLLLARLLRLVADRVGAVALRAGRIRLGLTAVQMSRQPGTDRVFALAVVAIAMVGLTAGVFSAGRAERADRAGQELGAARVLTVTAKTRTQLLYAVRQADPSGRYAMAAVIDTTSTPPVLAVDSGRYKALTGKPYVAGTSPEWPLITGSSLTVRVDSERRTTTLLGAVLQEEATGQGVQVEFRGIRPGAQSVTAAVPRCATAPGCRLVSFQLYTPAGSDDGALTIRGLSAGATTVLSGAQLGDVSRWRPDFTGAALRVRAAADGLRLAVGPSDEAGTSVYAVDTPLPLPIELAGPRPNSWRFADSSLDRFGDPATPVRVVATPDVLPVLGRAGVLTDLDAARRLSGAADQGGTFQVWLAEDAPAAVVEAIGLPVLADRTAAGRAEQLGAEDKVVTAPFSLFTVAVALLVAGTLVAIAASVDREAQLEQFRALRAQGLSRATALASGYAGQAALVVAALAGGVVAALIARPVAGVTAPEFADGWRVIPPPGALGPVPLGLAALAGLAVLGVTAWLSSRRLRGGLK